MREKRNRMCKIEEKELSQYARREKGYVDEYIQSQRVWHPLEISSS